VTLVLLVRGVELTIVLLLGEALSTPIYVGYALLKEGQASLIAVEPQSVYIIYHFASSTQIIKARCSIMLVWV